MESQNIEEYKALRHEITMLKGCVNTYIGFSFLVTSPAFWELAKALPGRPDPAMGFVALVIGLGIMLFLFLLSYKFHSHNRYCGYCKLLEQELFNGDGKNPRSVSLWETCLDRLRLSDLRENGLIPEIAHYGGSYPTAEALRNMSRQYSGPKPRANRGSVLGGWKLLLMAGSEKRGTWRFPLYVARIFAGIDLGFFGIGCTLLWPRVLLPLAAIVVGFLLWCLFLSRLHRQMNGSDTVDAFCWKFVSIRYRILDDIGLASRYRLVGTSQLPTFTSLPGQPFQEKNTWATATDTSNLR